jgi:hypothetical protein
MGPLSLRIGWPEFEANYSFSRSDFKKIRQALTSLLCVSEAEVNHVFIYSLILLFSWVNISSKPSGGRQSSKPLHKIAKGTLNKPIHCIYVLSTSLIFILKMLGFC